METTSFAVLHVSVPTGPMVLRMREMGGPIYGYIMREPGLADPQFVITNNVYLDNPDISIQLTGIATKLATEDLHSKELVVTLKGPVTFRPDGRMDVALRSTADVLVRANLTANLDVPSPPKGTMDLRIPAGEMRITLAGPLLR